MAKVAAIQTTFNTGEISPDMLGRVDFAKYKSAVKSSTNLAPLVEGPLTRRPATQFVAEVKTSSAKTRIVKFVFSTTQAYVIELGNLYARFYANHGQIVSGMSAVELVTPYTTAELFDLQFVQSNDVLYVAHPSHPPGKISRTSNTAWTYTLCAFTGGPFLPDNVDQTIFLYTTATGALIEGRTGIALKSFGAAIFNANHVGALFRFTQIDGRLSQLWAPDISFTTGDIVRWGQNFYKAMSSSSSGTEPPTHITGSEWDGPQGRGTKGTLWLYLHSGVGIMKVTAYTDPNHVTVTAMTYLPAALKADETIVGGVVTAIVPAADNAVNGADNTSTGTNIWGEGLWSMYRGYPAAVRFFEDRLVWGGAAGSPERLDGSKTGDYENLSPSDLRGVVADDDAISFRLRSSDVQQIRWITDDEQGLIVGTTGAVWIVRPSALGEALTPTNVSAKRIIRYGVAKTPAVQFGLATIFAAGDSAREIREITYAGYQAQETGGFASRNLSAFAKHITIGGASEFAILQIPHPMMFSVRPDGVLLGLLYEREQDVYGWHKHTLGGSGVVESLTSIPAPDLSYEELWLVVRRTINGTTKRYIEVMTKFFEEGDAQVDAKYGDCGLAYSGAPVTTLTGATHLIGETVGVLADGAYHADAVVDGSGHIALTRPTSKAWIGEKYNSDVQLLRSDAGSANGTAQGKSQRSHRVTARVNRTLGLKWGPDFGHLVELTIRRSSDLTDAAVPLYTGDIADTFEQDYTPDNEPCFRFDGMFPGTLMAWMPQMDTQDR